MFRYIIVRGTAGASKNRSRTGQRTFVARLAFAALLLVGCGTNTDVVAAPSLADDQPIPSSTAGDPPEAIAAVTEAETTRDSDTSDVTDTSQAPSPDQSSTTTDAPVSTTAISPATTSTPPTTDAPSATTDPTTSSAAPSTTPPTTATPAQPQPTGQQLFVDPNNSAAQWASNNSTDPRAATIASEIGSQPIARWFGDWNGDVGADVAAYVGQAQATGAVPALVAYNIPDRDCGQHSSGGAANFDAYDAWISSLASGLGNSGAIVILEPDALALNGCAGSERNDAINDAVLTIKESCTNCSVYLDAGHSNWVAPAEMANRLLDAGVMDADGFFTNVSNYNATNAEQAFGSQVLNALSNPDGLGQVIDTSRNGNGANGEWCDAAGRAIGDNPTLQTGSPTVDALLWVKVPGEADGCIAGAGQFVPDRAFALANG